MTNVNSEITRDNALEITNVTSAVFVGKTKAQLYVYHSNEAIQNYTCDKNLAQQSVHKKQKCKDKCCEASQPTCYTEAIAYT